MNVVSLYILNNDFIDSGTADVSSADNQIFDLTKDWSEGQFAGRNLVCKIVAGTGVGEYNFISNNGPTDLEFGVPFTFTPDATTEYEIWEDTTNRIELFSDEKISVTSSIASVNDLGKIFTDFSQSFTIPASTHNNTIFRHWYESQIDGGFQHGKRYDGYIKINNILFKKGNFQLEKANRKNGMIESYTITFYGNLTQLKDLFKDDKLNSLDYSSLNHTYDSDQVIDRIQYGASYDVMYPILGSAKKFEYRTLDADNDITLSTGAVKWNELFPAIKLTSIISFIQNKYGITFTGSFLTLKQWTKLRLYCKNAEELEVYTEPLKVNFTSKDTDMGSDVNLTTDIVKADFFNGWPTILPTANRRIKLKLVITPAAGYTTKKYKVFVYSNGSYTNYQPKIWQIYEELIGQQSLSFYESTINETHLYNDFNFFVSSEESIVFTSRLDRERYIPTSLTSGYYTQINSAYGTAQTTVANINISTYIPDISVVDFMTGLVKMFNLMIIPTSKTSFELIPLELYYQAGNVSEITEFIQSENADIERPKLYKSINFQYEKSENILNNAFYTIFNIEYGDLILNNDNANESQSYEIKVPFENVLFERAIGYNFETATFIDKDLKPYTPKPVFMYENGLSNVSSYPIYITTFTGTTTINNYNRFSNEILTVPSDMNYLMSSNFGEYQSPWYNINASRGLFFRHYMNYIINLYNEKTRIVKLKAMFSDMFLSTLKLNDRVIIRNKRYIINQYTADLTTGETDLELINDYRGADAAMTVGYRFSSSDVIMVDNTAKDVEYLIYLNEYDSFNILEDTGATFIRWGDSTDNITDTNLLVTIDANASGFDRNNVIPIEYFKNGVSVLTTYLNVLQYA